MVGGVVTESTGRVNKDSANHQVEDSDPPRGNNILGRELQLQRQDQNNGREAHCLHRTVRPPEYPSGSGRV